jgi:hypothetical protein
MSCNGYLGCGKSGGFLRLSFAVLGSSALRLLGLHTFVIIFKMLGGMSSFCFRYEMVRSHKAKPAGLPPF